MKNKVGGLAMVRPYEGASQGVTQHAGKIVTCIGLAETALAAGLAWETWPMLKEENGLVIAWHDDDLLPMGGNPDEATVSDHAEHAA